MNEPQLLSTGNKKQEILIADSTGKANLVLWEADINKVSEGRSYQLNRLEVQTYLGNTNLSFPQCGASVDDISAKLFIQCHAEGRTLSLRAYYNESLKLIAESTPQDLLLSAPFDALYNDYNLLSPKFLVHKFFKLAQLNIELALLIIITTYIVF